MADDFTSWDFDTPVRSVDEFGHKLVVLNRCHGPCGAIPSTNKVEWIGDDGF